MSATGSTPVLEATRAGIVVGLVATWELLSRTGAVSPRLLPPPSEAVATLGVLLEGLRIAMIFNFTGVMLAEMYASRAGIGHQIAVWGENFMMKELLAGVLLVAACAILFNEAVRWVETRCSGWRT